MDEQYFDAVMVMTVDGEDLVSQETVVVADPPAGGGVISMSPKEPLEIRVPVAGTVKVLMQLGIVTVQMPAPGGGTLPFQFEPSRHCVFGPAMMYAGDIVCLGRR